MSFKSLLFRLLCCHGISKNMTHMYLIKFSQSLSCDAHTKKVRLDIDTKVSANLFSHCSWLYASCWLYRDTILAKSVVEGHDENAADWLYFDSVYVYIHKREEKRISCFGCFQLIRLSIYLFCLFRSTIQRLWILFIWTKNGLF